MQQQQQQRSASSSSSDAEGAGGMARRPQPLPKDSKFLWKSSGPVAKKSTRRVRVADNSVAVNEMNRDSVTNLYSRFNPNRVRTNSAMASSTMIVRNRGGSLGVVFAKPADPRAVEAAERAAQAEEEAIRNSVIVTPAPLPRALRPATIAVSADGTHIPTTTSTGQQASGGFKSGIARSTLVVPVADDISSYGVGLDTTAASLDTVYNNSRGLGARPMSAQLYRPSSSSTVGAIGGGPRNGSTVSQSMPMGGPRPSTAMGHGGATAASTPPKPKKVGPSAMKQMAVNAANGAASSSPTNSNHRAQSPTSERTFTGRPISAMARFPRCATESINMYAAQQQQQRNASRPQSAAASGGGGGRDGMVSTLVGSQFISGGDHLLTHDTSATEMPSHNNTSSTSHHFQQARRRSTSPVIVHNSTVGAGGGPTTMVVVDAFGRAVNPVATSGAVPFATSTFAVPAGPAAATVTDSQFKSFASAGVAPSAAEGMGGLSSGSNGNHPTTSTTSFAPSFHNSSFAEGQGGGNDEHSRQSSPPPARGGTKHHTNNKSALNTSAATTAVGSTRSTTSSYYNIHEQYPHHIVHHHQPLLNATQQNSLITHERDVRLYGSAIGGGLESAEDGDCSHSLAALKRKGNAWFGVNRRPASALRRGAPMWGGVGDSAAISLHHSRAVDQPNASKHALLKHRQLLTDPIRNRVPHHQSNQSVVGARGGAGHSNITLMQGAVRRDGSSILGGGDKGNRSRETSTTSAAFSGIGELTRNSRGLVRPSSAAGGKGSSGGQQQQRNGSVISSVDGAHYGHSATTEDKLAALDTLEVNALDEWVPAKSLGEEVANAVTAMWSGKRRQPFYHPMESGGGGGNGNPSNSNANALSSAATTPQKHRSISARRSRFDDVSPTSASGSVPPSNASNAPSGGAVDVRRMSSYMAVKQLPRSASRTHTIDAYHYEDTSSSEEELDAAAEFQQAFNNISKRGHRNSSTSSNGNSGNATAAAKDTAGTIASTFAGVGGSASSDPVANAAYYRSIISGPVGLPTYKTSRYSKHASVSWDMVMEVPLEVTQRVLEERSRFEEW